MVLSAWAVFNQWVPTCWSSSLRKCRIPRADKVSSYSISQSEALPAFPTGSCERLSCVSELWTKCRVGLAKPQIRQSSVLDGEMGCLSCSGPWKIRFISTKSMQYAGLTPIGLHDCPQTRGLVDGSNGSASSCCQRFGPGYSHRTGRAKAQPDFCFVSNH